MSRVVHFEIQVDDVERAKSFYGAVLGWSFQDWSQHSDTEYWSVVTGAGDEPGIDGGLLRRVGPAPEAGRGTNAFVCTVQVDDYDETRRRILDAGGREVQPKTALPGMAWQGYYLDPEGNVFGIHQPDPDAR
jgi:predicted enzyme related to lactoylglutathione lyase